MADYSTEEYRDEEEERLRNLYYTVEEYAQVIHTEPETVRDLYRHRKIPGAFKVTSKGSSRILIPKDAPGRMSAEGPRDSPLQPYQLLPGPLLDSQGFDRHWERYCQNF